MDEAKNQFTKKRLTQLVELAWDVANHANISPNPLNMPGDDGKGTFDSVRWQTYLKLFDSILPKNNVATMDATMTEAKEGWQE